MSGRQHKYWFKFRINANNITWNYGRQRHKSPIFNFCFKFTSHQLERSLVNCVGRVGLWIAQVAWVRAYMVGVGQKIAWAEWVAWSVIQYGIFKSFSYFGVFFKSFYATDITSKYKIRVYIYRYFTEGPEYNHCYKSLSFFSRQPFVLWDLNLFVSNTPFLYPLKTSEDLMVFWCFQGEEKGCIGTNGLSKGHAFSAK